MLEVCISFRDGRYYDELLESPSSLLFFLRHSMRDSAINLLRLSNGTFDDVLDDKSSYVLYNIYNEMIAQVSVRYIDIDK